MSCVAYFNLCKRYQVFKFFACFVVEFGRVYGVSYSTYFTARHEYTRLPYPTFANKLKAFMAYIDALFYFFHFSLLLASTLSAWEIPR